MEQSYPHKKVKMEEDSENDKQPIVGAFDVFREELDEHHARRERIIKKSRDITDLSKKIIFTLHRVRGLGKPLQGKIQQDVASRLEQIANNFSAIAPDLAGVNAWRYQWQISPGIQEYIEAISFKHYLETKRLITIQEVQDSVPPNVIITEPDYVLGLFDLTGELMRYAITSIASGNDAVKRTETSDTQGQDDQVSSHGTLGPIPSQILQDMRELRVLFEGMAVPKGSPLKKQFGSKLEVMCNSVSKVENAAFEVLVRGSELPSGWAPDTSGRDATVGIEGY
ncbi:translin-associated factor TraX [Ascosphaera apis ARSEF 7405]|uniref:Translin-associated factor TraX n=1 Tax=Ascosphaera apis ARSEF 7405 TaxID=392613 RepID=A0A167WNL3_9EURO|nr:translin-associated factor TraX [Ascosphaera apis ARSEF 7405]